MSTERRVFIPTMQAGEAHLSDEESSYVRKVLRMGPGDEVQAFDGAGRLAKGHLLDVPRRGLVRVALEAPTIVPFAGRQVRVGLSCPKGERADWAVEKLTELGVRHITWLPLERSGFTPPPSRSERFVRVAIAAVRQSRRAYLPQIDSASSLEEFLGACPQGMIAHPKGEPLMRYLGAPLPEHLGALVGPEGGWTPGELEQCTHAGYTRVWLNQHILRVETAAVVAAAVLLGT